mmetsp:Transcript_6791/g.25665  ORF Transcript_6791/g.25665 Transcript_6791/m.25665 type:complete len:226 (+) Transcript_6791:495-1172(+)
MPFPSSTATRHTTTSPALQSRHTVCDPLAATYALVNPSALVTPTIVVCSLDTPQRHPPAQRQFPPRKEGTVSKSRNFANGHFPISPLRVSLTAHTLTLPTVFLLRNPLTKLHIVENTYGTLINTARSSSCGYTASLIFDTAPKTLLNRLSVPLTRDTWFRSLIVTSLVSVLVPRVILSHNKKPNSLRYIRNSTTSWKEYSSINAPGFEIPARTTNNGEPLFVNPW